MLCVVGGPGSRRTVPEVCGDRHVWMFAVVAGMFSKKKTFHLMPCPHMHAWCFSAFPMA